MEEKKKEITEVDILKVKFSDTELDGKSDQEIYEGAAIESIDSIEFSVIAPEERTAILPGDVVQLSVTVSPAMAEVPMFIWETDNAEVATVTGDGMLMAVTVGTVKVTATLLGEIEGIDSSISMNLEVVAVDESGTEVTPEPGDDEVPPVVEDGEA